MAEDHALTEDDTGAITTHDRVLLKALGSICLGDRYAGTISYHDGILEVGPDQGWFERGDVARRKVPVQ
jgi:hypothetical protein